MNGHLQRVLVTFTNGLLHVLAAIESDSIRFRNRKFWSSDPLNQELVSLLFDQSRADRVLDGKEMVSAVCLDVQERICVVESLPSDLFGLQNLVFQSPGCVSGEAEGQTNSSALKRHDGLFPFDVSKVCLGSLVTYVDLSLLFQVLLATHLVANAC